MACREIGEPVETLVVVNGAHAAHYDGLRGRHPKVRWTFHDDSLGFAAAVAAGLRRVRFPWTYLLDSDVQIQAETLSSLLPLRSADVFSIGSQIFYKDRTRFREETNLTALRMEDGLVTIHDRIPTHGGVTESLYVGGGASLFRTSLLRRFARDSKAYAPFYWEDAEWGWRARKLGLRNLFCPSSIVYHEHRATIGKFYGPDQIEEIIARNRLLFHLRNFTGPTRTGRLLEEISRSPEGIAQYLLAASTLRGAWWSRIWNYRAPVDEVELLAAWTLP